MSVTQWKDRQGRAWSFRITIADAKRMKAAGYDIGDAQGFQPLFANALTFIEIVTEALRPQWTEAGLDCDQFVDVITEDVGSLDEVRKCFQQGLTDFFLRIGEKATAKIVDMAAEAVELQAEAMIKRAESPEIRSFINRALAKEDSDYQERLAKEEAKLFGETSKNVAESSAPTQEPGPIAN